jgi:hypothetical protein
MRSIKEPSRYLPIVDSVDVVVIGGGVSGIAASIASSRKGAKTLLIERYGFLGGMATAGLVTTIPPIHYGIGLEMERRVKELGGMGTKGPFWTAYDPEVLKFVLMDMICEAGVKLLLHTLFVDTVVEDGFIKAIIVENKSGRQAIEAGLFIDATGDGDVSVSAGAEYLKGEEDGSTLPMTLMFNMRDVNLKRARPFLNAIKSYLKRSVENKEIEFSLGIESYDGQPGVIGAPLVHEDEVTIWGGLVGGLNGTKAEDLTKAEIVARKHALILANYLKKKIPGFESAKITVTATQIGVRESRRIVGDYILTLQDAKDRKWFSDSVARIKHGKWDYYVPFRCLTPKGVRNLLVSGRCISAARDVLLLTGLREIPACMSTGEAAGIAAALCAKQKIGPRKLNMKLLQQTLVNMNVFQPA